MPDFTETCVRRRELFRGSVIFRVDRIRLPNGRTAVREFMDHPGAVAAVPLLPGGRVVLVRQHRYAVGETIVEIPAGKLHRGEDRLSCVRRELREETGYSARSITKLLSYWPTPAFANEVIHIYVARGLKRGAMNLDADEFLEPFVVPFRRAVDWALNGRIRDSKTIIALLACKARGLP